MNFAQEANAAYKKWLEVGRQMMKGKTPEEAGPIEEMKSVFGEVAGPYSLNLATGS